MRNKTKDYAPVSVGGWLGTILLSAVPGLNLILWIIWAFAARRPSRRSFSIAMLILTGIFVVLVAAAICLFGSEILEWARSLDPELFTPKAVG